PKMISKESHVRPIGYGAMLMEGVVGIVALFAAASMPPNLYYDINVDLDKAQEFQPKLAEMYKTMPDLDVDNVAHLPVQKDNLADIETKVGGESLRGRTGGAV